MNKQLSLSILVLLFLLVLITTAHSGEEEKDRLLVMPLKAQKGIDQEEAIILTDILSIEIHRSGRYTILNREDMKTMLDEKAFEQAMGCDDNVCLLENVAKLAVNKIITGNIGKLGRKYIISLRMINEDGENVMMEQESCACEIDELDKTIEKISYKFLKYLDGGGGGYGSIRVESKPGGAEIYLDGALSGTAPSSLGRIEAGPHSLSVKKDGYSKWCKSVDVKVGKEVSIKAILVEEKLPTYTEPNTGSELVLVKGGCYQMGDIFGDGAEDEKPVHEVCVDDFYIGKYEVTVGEFTRFVKESGYRTEAETGGGIYCWTGSGWIKDSDKDWDYTGFWQTDNHPVVGVSWNDAQKFITWLNSKSGKNYRLLTEAEWEYAARSGGKNEKYAGFSDKNELYLYSNFCDSGCEHDWKVRGQDDGFRKTAPVGSYRQNGIGIKDMTGNVWEWCQDVYSKGAYKKHEHNNPLYAESGSYRVFRGGSWVNAPKVVRVYKRSNLTADGRDLDLGFRIARTP
ncbi:MAG: SUMF1/EgtB/PvdO family nonheme iron enzyme [Planctomycetes bacterium]|nr:SUMF1/EgtB/PvdO family nonheme iron enzyme [Planctomycetota bacterium]